MTDEELAKEIAEHSKELYLLGRRAGEFDNSQIMHIAHVTLKAMSISLDAIVESLMEE